MAELRKPHYVDTGLGFPIPKPFSLEGFKETLKTYRARPDDVFIATFPKCGTTYLQQIVYLIMHQGEPPADRETFRSCCPFLEGQGLQSLLDMPRPNAIKCHLPFYAVPYSSHTKYIYMARNPKDCVVSKYYHAHGIQEADFNQEQFDYFFEMFMDGKTEFGNFYEHVLSWYEHRNDSNVLFTYYEETTANPKEVILKIAKFLGADYGKNVESDEKLLEDIVRYSSFGYMKEVTNTYFKNNHIRRGQRGGWRSILSEEQSERIDQLITAKLANTDAFHVWKKHDCI